MPFYGKILLVSAGIDLINYKSGATPTAWHKLGSEPIVCGHMLNHLPVNIFFALR